MNQPNPKYHLIISLVKSALRIGAGMALVFSSSLLWCGVLLIAAEVLGIAEELV